MIHIRARRRLLLCAALGFAVVAAAGARASAAPLTLASLRGEAFVQDPQLAPDGHAILIRVLRTNFAANRYDAELYVVAPGGGAPVRIAARLSGVRSARWSADSREIAFIAKGQHEPFTSPQIYVLDPDTGETRQLTALRDGVAGFVWLPGHGGFVFVKRGATAAAADAPFRAGRDDFLAEGPPSPASLWRVDESGANAVRVATRGIGNVTSGSAQLAASRDGNFIGFAGTDDAYGMRFASQRGRVLDVRTGAVTAVSRAGVWSGAPVFLTSGEIAFERGRHGSGYFQHELVRRAADGRAVPLSRALDVDVDRFVANGDGVVLSAPRETRSRLWALSRSRGVRAIDVGPLSVYGFSAGRSGDIAFTAQSASRPSELYLLGAGGPARRLTHFNDALVGLDSGRAVTVHWMHGGFHESGVLRLPRAVVRRARYPLAVVLHGGPVATSTLAFDDGDALPALLAAHGYAVFEPNFRGSNNAGDAFTEAIRRAVSRGPAGDVLAGIDALRLRRDVDVDCASVSGWSGGGSLATWLAATTPRFRALVAGAAVTNWTTQYALGGESGPPFVTSLFGASPYAPGMKRAYEASSPITYARAITAPALVITTSRDAAVPFVESYELHRALQDNGRTVRLVVYPGGGHFPGGPREIEDLHARWIAWLDRYTGRCRSEATSLRTRARVGRPRAARRGAPAERAPSSA
jgi:dipeptidyl aminopeptidase/acylaminoacyl peptidase